MKKTITLVVLFCISALDGMEPREPVYSRSMSVEKSPLEVKEYIASIINLYNNVDTAINAIKADSPAIPNLTVILNDNVGHQKEFAELVHALAKAFNRSPYVVAAKIGTPAAQIYQTLGESLLSAVKIGDINAVISLIKHDADINYGSRGFFRGIKTPDGEIEIRYDESSPLTYAVIFGRSEIVKLLLDAGVNSESDDYYKSHGYYPAELNTSFGVTGTKKDRKEIKRMINEATVKKIQKRLDKGL